MMMPIFFMAISSSGRAYRQRRQISFPWHLMHAPWLRRAKGPQRRTHPAGWGLIRA
jgi:hypothetical protein